MESAVRMVAARLATELCEPEIYQTCYKAGYVCVCLLKKKRRWSGSRRSGKLVIDSSAKRGARLTDWLLYNTY